MTLNRVKNLWSKKNIFKRSIYTSPISKSDSNKFQIINGLIFSGIMGYSIYYFLQKNTRKYENITINEINDDIEYIRIVNDKFLIAKKKYSDVLYRMNIPNYRYLEKKNIDNNIPVHFENTEQNDRLLGSLISLSITGLFIYLIFKRSNNLPNFLNIIKPPEINYNSKIKFKDIVGQKNAKNSIMEYVDILKNRNKYNKIGVKVPKGALLSGPPGTGKTLLAKAVAGEAGLPFLTLCASEFNAMFVGMGGMKVKALYSEARKLAEIHGGCIIFIDEIDAIGQKRSSINNGLSGNSERETTLNQLLTEMDGFENSENIITFAATNRSEILDDAIIRSGRLDRKIILSLPNLVDRKKIFCYYLSKLNINSNLIEDISSLACALTPGLSPADIANIVNESGIIAVRKNKEEIEMNDVKEAIDYVLMGNISDININLNEKETIAYHEAGHAFMSYVLSSVPNPLKVTIIPREKGMLGYSQSEYIEQNLITKKQMEENLMVCMGGKVSEEIFCNTVSNGSYNDIEKATEISKKYIECFGFDASNKFMNVSNVNLYKNDLSEYIKNNNDRKIINLLNTKYDETYDIINNNKNKIIKIKDLLLRNETIYFNEIKDLVDNTKED